MTWAKDHPITKCAVELVDEILLHNKKLAKINGGGGGGGDDVGGDDDDAGGDDDAVVAVVVGDDDADDAGGGCGGDDDDVGGDDDDDDDDVGGGGGTDDEGNALGDDIIYFKYVPHASFDEPFRWVVLVVAHMTLFASIFTLELY